MIPKTDRIHVRTRFKRRNTGCDFTADDFGAPYVWFSARKPETLFEDSAGTIPASFGGPVGRWVSINSASRYWSQPTTAKKPTLIGNAQNGLPTVFGDGVDDLMLKSGIFMNGAARTELMVLGNPNDSDRNVIGVRSPMALYRVGSTALLWQKNQSGVAFPNMISLGGPPVVIGFRFTNANNMDQFHNGTYHSSDAPHTDYENNGGSGPTLFSANTTGSNHYSGHVCEYVRWQTVLTVADIMEATNQLRCVWGI